MWYVIDTRSSPGSGCVGTGDQARPPRCSCGEYALSTRCAHLFGSQEAARGGRNHARCGLSRSERREAAGDSAGGNCQRNAASGAQRPLWRHLDHHALSSLFDSTHQHRVLTVVRAIEGRHCLPAFRREPRGISVSDVAKLFRAIRCHALILQDRSI